MVEPIVNGSEDSLSVFRIAIGSFILGATVDNLSHENYDSDSSPRWASYLIILGSVMMIDSDTILVL